MCTEYPSGDDQLSSWAGKLEDGSGPEENSWEPVKLWGRYGEVKEENCTREEEG